MSFYYSLILHLLDYFANLLIIFDMAYTFAFYFSLSTKKTTHGEVSSLVKSPYNQ